MPEPICLLCEKPGDQCACKPHGIFDAADLPDAWRTRHQAARNRLQLADSDQPPPVHPVPHPDRRRAVNDSQTDSHVPTIYHATGSTVRNAVSAVKKMIGNPRRIRVLDRQQLVSGAYIVYLSSGDVVHVVVRHHALATAKKEETDEQA